MLKTDLTPPLLLLGTERYEKTQHRSHFQENPKESGARRQVTVAPVPGQELEEMELLQDGPCNSCPHAATSSNWPPLIS